MRSPPPSEALRPHSPAEVSPLIPLGKWQTPARTRSADCRGHGDLVPGSLSRSPRAWEGAGCSAHRGVCARASPGGCRTCALEGCVCHTASSLSPALGGKQQVQKPSAELATEPHSCARTWPGAPCLVGAGEGWDEPCSPKVTAHFALTDAALALPPWHQDRWLWLDWRHSPGLRVCFPLTSRLPFPHL